MSAFVLISPEDLDALVRKAVREELAKALSADVAEPGDPMRRTQLPVSDDDVARARKNLRRFGRGT